jgi:hypothetical protein
MNVTDLDMFGAPTSADEMRRQINRGLYVFACALVYAEQCGLDVRVAMLPSLASNDPLFQELDRCLLKLNKLIVWAWDAPKSGFGSETLS